jgi:DNA-binding response OmpR family regulator
MRKKILAVDDEKDILRLLEHNLGKAGYDVISAGDGPEAIDIAKSEMPDLIILDVMLPNIEGTEVLKALKKDRITDKIPVMMLTAKGEELDRVVGLELGADDYIVKPFSPKELLLRVNVLLRKKGDEAGVIKAGSLAIDPGRFLATLNGRPLELTSTEFKLLSELASSGGRLLGREYLMKKACSGESHTTLRTIDAHVRRLRMKLGAHCGCIETVRGLGYRFNVDGLN